MISIWSHVNIARPEFLWHSLPISRAFRSGWIFKAGLVTKWDESLMILCPVWKRMWKYKDRWQVKYVCNWSDVNRKCWLWFAGCVDLIAQWWNWNISALLELRDGDVGKDMCGEIQLYNFWSMRIAVMYSSIAAWACWWLRGWVICVQYPTPWCSSIALTCWERERRKRGNKRAWKEGFQFKGSGGTAAGAVSCLCWPLQMCGQAPSEVCAQTECLVVPASFVVCAVWARWIAVQAGDLPLLIPFTFQFLKAISEE